jgi:hypothetical protein
MGITTENFFENIYQVIFAPKEFFEKEEQTTSIRLALCTIIFITIFAQVSKAILNSELTNYFFIFSLIGSIIGAILIWFLSALFFEYIAKIFNQDGKMENLLCLFAYAQVPIIFFAPLNLIKNLGDVGYILATNIEVLLYLWIICLYAFALRATYKLTLSRSFMLIFLPFIASFFAITWLIGFIQKMWYIFSI